MAYIDTATLKQYLGPSMSSSDDGLLASMIARAQQSIDSVTGRTFEASSDTTRYFDAIRDVGNALDDNAYRRVKVGYGRALFFDKDICQITSVTNGDGVVVASSSYTTEPRNDTPWYAIRLKDNADVDWTYVDSPENAIVVVGRWAYSIIPPADIVHACIRLAAFYYRQKDNTTDGDRPILAGDGNVIMPSAMPRDVLTLLQSYRRIV